jgi:integrase
MQEQYDIIKHARALLATVPKSTARESTIADYKSKVHRLARRCEGSGTFDALIAQALKTTKKASWQALRAALLFTARNALEKYLLSQDNMQRSIKASIATGQAGDWSAWHMIVSRVEYSRESLQAVLDAQLPLEGRRNRHTKRQDMKGLPRDWRERLVARMPTYAAATLTAAVTGCRPSELAKGVQLSIEDEMLVAHILGTKVDLARGKGQEWRRLSWPIGHQNEMVRDLAMRVREAGGELLVRIEHAGNFSKAVSNAGGREWPTRKAAITPYCFRHQCAADMKAGGGLTSGEISAALGHVSDQTKSTYGHAGIGHAGGVAPARVSASLAVKTKEPSAQAKKRTARIRDKALAKVGMVGKG